MLSRKQWQWLADHHVGVRQACLVFIGVAFFAYVGLVCDAMWKKGKAPSPYVHSEAQARAGCMRPPLERYPYDLPIKYGDGNPFKLESFYSEVLDVNVLIDDPACFDAILFDEQKKSSEYVIYLYDKKTGKMVYRISRMK
jgi:hypothetical protein